MMNSNYWWRGVSGNEYVHTRLKSPRDLRGLGACNYIFARIQSDGSATPLYIGQTSNIERRFGEHVRDGLVNAAIRLGFNELHVHLLASSEERRFSVETDLRNGNATALNKQPSNALLVNSHQIGQRRFGTTSNALNALATFRKSGSAQDFQPRVSSLAK